MGELHENIIKNGGQSYRVSIYAPLVRNAKDEPVEDTATIEAYTDLANFLLTGLYGLCGREVPPFCIKVAEVSPDNLGDIHTAVEIATVNPKADNLDVVQSDAEDVKYVVALQNYYAENKDPKQNYFGIVKVEVHMIGPRAECGKPPYNDFATRALAQLAYCEYAACVKKYFPEWYTRYDDGLHTEFFGIS